MAFDGGIKHDGDKGIRPELLDISSLEGVSRVLAYGAKKYEANNWRKGFQWTRLIGSTLRHLYAFARGEDVDPETGLPHIDHVMCNVMFLSAHQKHGYGVDDRIKPPE